MLHPENPLTHVRDGKPTMVDVSLKPVTQRTAVAEAVVELGQEVMARLENNDLHGPKGPVFQTAIIAGTMAVKNTSTLIPFCHPLPVEGCDLTITPQGDGVVIRCTVRTMAKTGVEMEAMTGASAAALTIYDMAKAMNKGIVIRAVRLISKTGGKSGDFHCAGTPSSRQICGLVLAGGRSSRMGTDKAALRHADGRTLARRAVDLLAEAGCGAVAVSLRHDQAMPEGLGADTWVVRDPVDGSAGPLSGMLAAMRAWPEADWLVVACDLPRLDAATLTALITGRRTDEPMLAFRSEHDGLPEPLCAYYAREAAHILAAARDAGMNCPRKILITRECRLLDPVRAGALDNANTPEEWQAATQS